MITSAKILVWLSLALGILGQFISFYPGSEFGWFILCALLAAPAIFVFKNGYRVASSIIFIAWISFAIAGFYHGQEYQAWLNNHSFQKSSNHHGDKR